MLFHPPPRRLCETLEKCHELGHRVSRAPSIACDLAKTRVHAKKMRQGSRATPEDCADQEPSQPGSVLQWIDLFPSEEGDRGGEQRRHILRARDGLAPRRQARILVPIEIIDHRIATSRRPRGQFGQEAVRALADRLEPGKVASERTIVRAFVWREPFLIERVDLILLGALRALRALPFRLGYGRSPNQCIQARGRESPLWRSKEDPPTRPQDRMGAGQFVGRRPNIHTRIV